MAEIRTGVSRGFCGCHRWISTEYITTYVLPFVMKNMDMTLGEIGDSFKLYGIEFRNLTTGYYVVESQKMEMSIKLDSLNVQLRMQLGAELYHNKKSYKK